MTPEIKSVRLSSSGLSFFSLFSVVASGSGEDLGKGFTDGHRMPCLAEKVEVVGDQNAYPLGIQHSNGDNCS